MYLLLLSKQIHWHTTLRNFPLVEALGNDFILYWFILRRCVSFIVIWIFKSFRWVELRWIFSLGNKNRLLLLFLDDTALIFFEVVENFLNECHFTVNYCVQWQLLSRRSKQMRDFDDKKQQPSLQWTLDCFTKYPHRQAQWKVIIKIRKFKQKISKDINRSHTGNVYFNFW